MEIHKILVLSTGNLPYKEFSTLGSFPDVSFVAIDHEYGCMVNIIDEENEFAEKTEELYPKLTKIIEYAKANGIKYINFDPFNETEKEFEQFDW